LVYQQENASVLWESKDRRVGVIRHTQGSGESLSMLFYAGCIIEEPAMENPTLVFLTDRNDLDDQIFGSASLGRD
jgi:type I restriction enzyme, R subunit